MLELLDRYPRIERALPWATLVDEAADTTGLSTVHVNRSLQRLSASGLILLRNENLKILDFGGSLNLASFTKTYLQTDGPPVEQKLPVTPYQLM